MYYNTAFVCLSVCLSAHMLVCMFVEMLKQCNFLVKAMFILITRPVLSLLI